MILAQQLIYSAAVMLWMAGFKQIINITDLFISPRKFCKYLIFWRLIQQQEIWICLAFAKNNKKCTIMNYKNSWDQRYITTEITREIIRQKPCLQLMWLSLLQMTFSYNHIISYLNDQ